MRYLYAVVGPAASLAMSRGAFDEELSLLPAGEVSAVVGALDEPPALTRKGLGGHDRVARALAEGQATLPARFGQLLAEAELRHALIARGRAFQQALELVDGCVQMTVRLALEETIDDDAPKVGHAHLGRGRAYLEERRARRSSPELDELRRALSSWTRADKVQIATDNVGARPRSLASLYQLVPRSDVDEWHLAFGRAREESGARMQATGPWPAYAFAPEVA